MKALVLAAGKGSRLAAVSGGLPKPLVPIGSTTPLEHNLAWVAPHARDGIWVNLHQGASVIRQRIGDAVAGVPVSWSHEPELLGTAGAWKRLEAEWSGTSLVIYGDNFMDFDLRALLQTHRRGGTPMTIAVFDPTVHANTGIGGGRVVLEGSRVVQFVEGASEGLVNAGAYCIEEELALRLPGGFSDFGRDVLPGLAAEGLLGGHMIEDAGYCLGLDTPERLALARELVHRQGARS
ncbi:MAG TPA: nucleotidyltransferase family protein [Longimicrobiales bacterium]|nr:nucleotidyltransferase family protein [Longimicrobiales bacterium]